MFSWWAHKLSVKKRGMMNKEKIQTVLESRLKRTFEPKFLFDGKNDTEREKRHVTPSQRPRAVKTMNELWKQPKKSCFRSWDVHRRRCRSYQMKIVFMTCYNGDTHKSLPEYIKFRDARDKDKKKRFHCQSWLICIPTRSLCAPDWQFSNCNQFVDGNIATKCIRSD